MKKHVGATPVLSTVIKKRSAAINQLRAHFRDGVKIAKWLWVASGKVHFANTEKARLRLDQNGIEFVGARVMAKHLPTTSSPTTGPGKASGRRKR